jgi:hypothetical protein
MTSDSQVSETRTEASSEKTDDEKKAPKVTRKVNVKSGLESVSLTRVPNCS